MKKLLLLLCLLSLPFWAEAQPAPTYEASSAQTAAMTVGAPFYISPRRLGEVSIVMTNVPLGTLTNMLNTWSNASVTSSTNTIIGYFVGTTNMVAFTNGPPTAGQAVVIVGTNVAGQVLIKGTNWPTGGGGSSIPSVLGIVTNTAGGVIGVGTAVPGTWIGSGTLPVAAADTSWAPVTNAVMTTNNPIASRSGQVPRMTGNTNTFGAPTANITNLFPYDLEFHVLTNAFTNVVICEIGPLTNKDGFIFYLFGGTNQ